MFQGDDEARRRRRDPPWRAGCKQGKGTRWQETRDRNVKATKEWVAASGSAYLPAGRTGTAHLRHYAARYSVWGDGPPLVLVPGLAGGLGLLGPLARQLANDFQVITYQLRGEDDWSALRQRFGLADLAADLA